MEVKTTPFGTCFRKGFECGTTYVDIGSATWLERQDFFYNYKLRLEGGTTSLMYF